MAIYHLSVKTVSRSAGRSATAAAAYRAGVVITDERTGEIHDYSRKGGVVAAALVLPAGAPAWATDRAALWNAAEQAEKRKNSTVAREFEIALPDELSPEQRHLLAHDLAREIVERHGCAADVAVHAPGKDGDIRNHHAHILLTTRRLTQEGFTEKTRELDDQKTGSQIVTEWRERFASLQNERLRESGVEARVDHRTLEAQGINREPTRHLGPAASGFERRTGQPSQKRLDFEIEVAERLLRAKEVGELERKARTIESAILDLSGNISAAKAERDRQDDPIARRRRIEDLDARIRAIDSQPRAERPSLVEIHEALVKNARDEADRKAREKKSIPPSMYQTELTARQAALAEHMSAEPRGLFAKRSAKYQDWEAQKGRLERSVGALEDAITKRDEVWHRQEEQMLQDATVQFKVREEQFRQECQRDEDRRKERQRLETERDRLTNLERAAFLRRAAETFSAIEEGRPNPHGSGERLVAEVARAARKDGGAEWLRKGAEEYPKAALQEMATRYVGTSYGADQRAQEFLKAIGHARGDLDARSLVQDAASAEKERQEQQQQLRLERSPKAKGPSGPGFT